MWPWMGLDPDRLRIGWNSGIARIADYGRYHLRAGRSKRRTYYIRLKGSDTYSSDWAGWKSV